MDYIIALDLPKDAQVNQRVPKKLLVEHGAPTAGDKRLINDGIEELRWRAALKPHTVGVPEYRDTEREYLEIAVLTLALRPGAKRARLEELVHRAVPYPVFLVTTQAPDTLNTPNTTVTSMSLAHKRWSQAEKDKIVLDEGHPERVVLALVPTETERSFIQALQLKKQPRSHMLALYQGWLDMLLALQAARITGAFAMACSPEHGEARKYALRECARLEAQLAGLRSEAAKEKQIAKRVELNLEYQQLQAQLETARARL